MLFFGSINNLTYKDVDILSFIVIYVTVIQITKKVSFWNFITERKS